MKEIFEKRFFTQLTTIQLYLIAGNFLLVFFLILLSNLGILPVKNLGDFIFFVFLILAFALYRPGWAFLIFIGTIVLENINLAPDSLGIAVRPYQFFGAIVIWAMLVRLIARRLNFSLEKPQRHDLLVILFAIASFISALGSPDRALSFKLAIVIASFAVLYFLIRNYIRDIDDLKKVMPVFVSSSLVVVLYAIWQNMRFIRWLPAYEVMPGRPNSTFPEADWLGIFLVFLISVIYALIYFKQNTYAKVEKKYRWKEFILPYVFLTLAFITLLLTVSRSAWLGAFITTFFFLFIVLTELKFDLKNWQWKMFAGSSVRIFLTFILGLGIILIFHLSSFQFFNRAQSVGTGLQKITIACVTDTELPEKITSNEVLPLFGCRQINLEEIAAEESQGNVIKEIYREDPNVNIRKEIYEKSWQEIRKNPLLGIGWGGIGKVLGTDERGASLNASNIFLEIWLGSGLLGLLSFLALWIYALLRNVKNFMRTEIPEKKALTVFIVITWFGLTVANLFNAGIMLGFLWLFLAISFIDLGYDTHRN